MKNTVDLKIQIPPSGRLPQKLMDYFTSTSPKSGHIGNLNDLAQVCNDCGLKVTMLIEYCPTEESTP